MLKPFVSARWAVFFVALLVGSCAALCPALAAVETTPAPVQSVPDYELGIGDKVKMITFGEADLSGEFEISSTGSLSIPLVGEVPAAGLTVSKLQAIVVTKLKDGYMKDPKVSLQVIGYRPFFIVGEVMKPGSYNYVNGMTVINAVAMAGGYTYRADKGDIAVKHKKDEKVERVKETAPVLPGDVITVSERFF